MAETCIFCSRQWDRMVYTSIIVARSICFDHPRSHSATAKRQHALCKRGMWTTFVVRLFWSLVDGVFSPFVTHLWEHLHIICMILRFCRYVCMYGFVTYISVRIVYMYGHILMQKFSYSGWTPIHMNEKVSYVRLFNIREQCISVVNSLCFSRIKNCVRRVLRYLSCAQDSCSFAGIFIEGRFCCAQAV